MNRSSLMIAGLAIALPVLAGGASAAGAQPPRGGTIAIAARNAAGDDDPASRAFVAAAGKALTAKGFTVLDDPGHAAYSAELTISREDVGTALAKERGGARVTVGPGVIVPFPTGNSRLAALRRTRLAMRIRKLAGGIVWSGTAVTVRAIDTRTGTDDAVATDLGNALLAAYPAQPAGVIGVP